MKTLDFLLIAMTVLQRIHILMDLVHMLQQTMDNVRAKKGQSIITTGERLISLEITFNYFSNEFRVKSPVRGMSKLPGTGPDSPWWHSRMYTDMGYGGNIRVFMILYIA